MDDKLAAALLRLCHVRSIDVKGSNLGELAKLDWLVEEIDKVILLLLDDNRFTGLIKGER